MSRRDPVPAFRAVVIGLMLALFVSSMAVLLWTVIEDERAKTRCRDRGGRIEREWPDWNCVDARAEVPW
jgi:hypothetical protein